MSSNRNDADPGGLQRRLRTKWRDMPPGRKLYILMTITLMTLMTLVSIGSSWLACNGVRYVANVEDDSLLYRVFAWIIVSMAFIFAVAMIIGQIIIGKFVKRIEQDRLAKEQMSRAMARVLRRDVQSRDPSALHPEARRGAGEFTVNCR